MAKLSIQLLFIFICSFTNAQNMKELYLETFEGDWKKYEDAEYVKKFKDTTVVYNLDSGKSYEQTLLDQSKRNHLNRANRISQVIENFNLNISALDSLVFVEQFDRKLQPMQTKFIQKGMVIANDSVYGFSYDLDFDDKIESYDYLKISKNEIIGKGKQIIAFLILSGKSNYLDSLAGFENEFITEYWIEDYTPEIQFEILLYNRKKEPALRRIYLSEIFAELIKASENRN